MRIESVWCCPACRGSLVTSAPNTRLSCERCSAEFWVSGGIPDLRVDRPAWLDIDEDREAAARLDRDFASKSLEEMVRAAVLAVAAAAALTWA